MFFFESMDELMHYAIKIAEETEDEKGSFEFAAATFKINEVSKPDDFPEPFLTATVHRLQSTAPKK